MADIEVNTATRLRVAAADADTLLLDCNTARRGAFILNDSGSTLRIAYGTEPATEKSFTVAIGPRDAHTVAFGYRGMIRGIWERATGAALVTELT
jgi:hypothetical protein